MSDAERVFDEGLQLERTALSWQRTLLALIVGSLVAGRGLHPLVGDVSWLIAGLGVAAGIAGIIVARRRYLAAHRRLVADPVSLAGGAALIALTTLGTLGVGLAALAFAIQHSL